MVRSGSGSAMASNFRGRIVIGTNKSYKIFLTPVSESMSDGGGSEREGHRDGDY